MQNQPRFEKIAKEICKKNSLSKPSFIGAGAFKEAYLTQMNGDIDATLKVFDPHKCNLCRAEREIVSMQQCESIYIGKIYSWGTFNLDNHSFLYIIEEYLSGGTLTDKMNSIQNRLNLICSYGIGMIKAVSYLREKSLVHRDIKPDNIMFRSSCEAPVLVDFGIVRDLSSTSLTRTYLKQGPGTPFFASPEQLNNEKHLIDWRSDQFSVGVILGIYLTGNHPYKRYGQTDIQIVEEVISRSGHSQEYFEQVNNSGFGFLAKMVAPWPINRFAHPKFIIEKLEKLKKENE